LPPNVVALQADVLYDAALLTIGPLAPGGAVHRHVLRSSGPAAGVQRLLAYSLKNEMLTNGAVVAIPFLISSNARVSALRVVLTNVILAAASSALVKPDIFSGAIVISPVYITPETNVQAFLDGVTADQRYLIQATTDFQHWVNISTNEAFSSIVEFMDFDARLYPYRFYRALLYDAAGEVGALHRSADGRVSLSFRGLAGRSYTLQASTNFVDWEGLGSYVAAGGIVSVTNLVDPNYPRRFFRLRSGD
jgi:hypothetical protein